MGPLRNRCPHYHRDERIANSSPLWMYFETATITLLAHFMPTQYRIINIFKNESSRFNVVDGYAGFCGY
jgi:hypothetical protein